MSKVEKVIQEYTEKFGGYPAFLLMGADDDYIIETLTKCIETGEELEAEPEDIY